MVKRWMRGCPSLAFAVILCFLALANDELNPVRAQEAPAGRASDNSCGFEDNKGFERRPIGGHHITSKFVTKPDAQADARKIRTHFIYSRILGTYASRQLSSSSLRRCAFTAETDASLDLHFELHGIGSNVHDECSLSRCARWLSDLIETTIIDAQAFSTTTKSVVEAFRSFDSPNPQYLRLGLRRATVEAYRHIYPTGSKEQILLDLSADDFVDLRFGEFTAWFSDQQTALRHAAQTRAAPPSNSSADGASCTALPDLPIEELSINRHGWGQQSIILIKNAFRKDGIDGISNLPLRTICHPNQQNLDDVEDTSAWRKMIGRVSCTRERVNRDRWLILFSKNEPVATSAEMRSYAQSIAGILKGDSCADPGLRIILTHFMQQK